MVLMVLGAAIIAVGLLLLARYLQNLSDDQAVQRSSRGCG